MTVTYLTEARTWLGVMRDMMPEGATMITDYCDASDLLTRNVCSVDWAGIRCVVWTFDDGSQILSSGQILKVVGE